MDVKDAALLVSTCITRNLPPALTLEQGLDKIKEAVNELKSKPPSCSSGMYRIQVLYFFFPMLKIFLKLNMRELLEFLSSLSLRRLKYQTMYFFS